MGSASAAAHIRDQRILEPSPPPSEGRMILADRVEDDVRAAPITSSRSNPLATCAMAAINSRSRWLIA
jgi:hypothetical protein